MTSFMIEILAEIAKKKVIFCRSSRAEVFCKEGVLEILQNSQENTYARVAF